MKLSLVDNTLAAGEGGQRHHAFVWERGSMEIVQDTHDANYQQTMT